MSLKESVKMDISANTDKKIQQQWLDKLWNHLFDGEASGLMSPGQIRRERRDRVVVRQLEMAAIFEAEQDVNKIHSGLKAIDNFGRVIDTPLIDTVATHSIIENNVARNSEDIGLETAATLLQAAVKEVGIRDLERSLNLRKIIILAESEIYHAEIRPISRHSVSAEWVLTWKLAAQDLYNLEIQTILARMLIHEIASPSSYSMSSLNALKLLSSEELEMVAILAKFSFGHFIFNASQAYFNSELYSNLFDNMDDLGFISGFDLEPMLKVFHSQVTNEFDLVLHCGAKAMNIRSPDSNKQLVLPIYKVSRVARQIMSLHSGGSDLAYLFEVAAHIKEQGFEVSLGEWLIDNDGQEQYIEKMAL